MNYFFVFWKTGFSPFLFNSLLDISKIFLKGLLFPTLFKQYLSKNFHLFNQVLRKSLVIKRMNIDGWTGVNISNLEHNTAAVRNILMRLGRIIGQWEVSHARMTTMSSFSN